MIQTKTAKLKMPPAPRLWTFDEMEAELPETNQHIELWDGELMMSPSPAPKHQTTIFRLARLLDDFVTPRKLGVVYLSPIDVVLSSRRVVQPDLVFVSNANSNIVHNQIRGVPDMMVEVISPGSWRRDTIDKRALYEQFGVKEYWIVDPEARAIDVLTLKQGTYQLLGRFGETQTARSELLKGLRVSVQAILP